jgi:phospholipid/cholesterol/gamma-HCH transport system substrate-binding protein
MQARMMEMLFGLFFALGVGAIFILTFKVASVEGVGRTPSFQVTALYENIGGLKPGSAVTLAGVRIGRVRDIMIDRTTFEAKVLMEIEQRYDNIPKDTTFKILTAGLLGEQYIGLEPGGDEQNLKDGDLTARTQSALVLENLIGQVLVERISEAKQ